jgi:hypothetical protein
MENLDATSHKVEILHTKVRTFLKEGLTHEQIIDKLKGEDLQPYYIETIISNIEDEDDDKKSLRNSIIMGGFFIIGGLILNILSYRASENMGSSSFILFWGIVVMGVVTVARGLILYRR